MSLRASWLALSILVSAACRGDDPIERPGPDAPSGSDASLDATHATDASRDDAGDAGFDAMIDASLADAAIDAADPPLDAASVDAVVLLDAALDAPLDAALDAPIDAPATGRFRTVGALAQVRLRHAAALLPDGRVLVAGGQILEPGATRWTWTTSAEVFDPVTETFAPVAPMAFAHQYLQATTLLDGRVLVTGAAETPGGLAPRTELFDPATSTFSAGPDTLGAHGQHTATLLADGRVLVAGESAEAYDPGTNSFHALPPLQVLAPWHAAVRLGNGRVLLAGGPHQGSSGGGTRDDAELFEPGASTFAVTGSMATARAAHALTPLPGGGALVTGGYIGLGGAVEVHASAEVYDPAGRAFASTDAMTTSRSYHTATPLADGRVLLTGGSSDGMGTAPDNEFETVATAELYDPTGRTFAPTTGTMATPRARHTATRLLDGRVLIVGGASRLGGAPATPTAELYEP